MKARPLIIIGALVAAAAAGATLLLTARTANPSPERLYLTDSVSPSALADSLKTRGIIADGLPATAYRLQCTLLKASPREGSYVVQPGMRVLALVRKLRNGQQDPVRLTIGKFRTPQQLNEYLDSKLMHNDFDVTLDSLHLVRPDTYEVYWTVTPEKFMQRMSDEYARFWNAAVGQSGELRADMTKKSDSFDYSPENIIILASIVEEETNNTAEKPLIASVYINRLERGIPLQADPTVKYAVGDFALRRILNKHLLTDSPFNTYLHTGLPPAPICLPSAASVDAVLNAPKTDYLYFCASEKMDGTHRFATTLAEHLRNAALFHAALNARGIK